MDTTLTDIPEAELRAYLLSHAPQEEAQAALDALAADEIDATDGSDAPDNPDPADSPEPVKPPRHDDTEAVVKALARGRVVIDGAGLTPHELHRRIWDAIRADPTAPRLRVSDGIVYRQDKEEWQALSRDQVRRIIGAHCVVWYSGRQLAD